MRRLLAISIALSVLAACTASKLDSSADVTISGAVLGADGQPLSNASVILFKEVDLGEAVFGLTFFAATVGTICLTDAAPAVCAKARRANTNAQGRYQFQLKGRDTQGLGGTASTFNLSTASGGASVSARFQVQKSDLSVPELRIWDPALELVQQRTLRASWPQRDPSNSERLVFFKGTGTDVVWSADGRSPLPLDPRLFEDVSGTAVVESEAKEDVGGTAFRLTYQSRRVTYTATTGAPPSRGNPCSPDPCTLTDGDLAPPTNAPPTRQDVTVDLTRSQTPTYIVVRACPAHCDVDTSVDGLAWKAVGSGDHPFFAVTPVLGTPVRFVKVRSTTDLNGLAEVSVWVA